MFKKQNTKISYLNQPDTEKERSFYVTTKDGYKLFFKESGNPDGQPILFVHGYSQSHLAWKKQFEAYDLRKFRLIAIDLLGHGCSDKPNDQERYINSKALADDIHNVIFQLNLDHPLICCWSYAGLIICDYIRHYGDSEISGINFICAAINSSPDIKIVNRTIDYEPILGGLVSNDVNLVLQSLKQFLQLLTFKELSPSDFLYFYGFNAIVPSYVREALVKRVVTNNDVLPKLEKPVLISLGRHDPYITLAAAEEFASLFKNQKLDIYDNAGHMPFWECENSFNEVLKNFALECQQLLGKKTCKL